MSRLPPSPSEVLECANALCFLLSFSTLYLYHTVRWYIKKRGTQSFTFTRNLMLEKGFSIGISRGLNTMGGKKNQRILQLEEILAVWEQGECTAQTERSHWMKRSVPCLLQTDPAHQALNSRTQSWRTYSLSGSPEIREGSIYGTWTSKWLV